MNRQKILCLFVIAFLYGAKAEDEDENSGRYDIGCYRRHDEFIKGNIVQALRNGDLLPACVEGGLWRPVQCGFYNCSCVYVDTGNMITNIKITNQTAKELAKICPNRSEEVINSCVRAPLSYPCSLNTIKYRYNNDTQRCEEVDYECYGFDTRDFCEETCETQAVEVDIEIQFRFRFRLRVPHWILSRYQLVLGIINRMNVTAFIEVNNRALSIRLTEEITTPIATTTTVPPSTTSSFEEETPMEIIARMQGNPQDICQLSQRKGPCRGYFPRWYFDPSVSRCRRFIYGGCLANGNNFVEHTECGRYCGAANQPSEEDLKQELFLKSLE